MSKMRKFMSLLLAAVMVLSMMTVNAFAADDGKITITNAKDGEIYEIYRLFDLETFDGAVGNYSYKAATDKWKTFFSTGEGADYIIVDPATGYILEAPDKNDEATAALLAELIAKNLPDEPDGSKEATSETVEFENLKLGYYLVTSTYGSSGICALTTTDKESTVYDKNTVPTIEKKVKEDSDDTWGEKNDADRGQEVEFRISVKTEKNASGYILTDKMPNGLTLDPDTIKVTLKGNPLDLSADVDGFSADGSGFTIAFGTLTTNVEDEILVTYTATVDGGANTNEKLENTATLTYDSDKELKATTDTYTWEIPVFKYTGNNTPLAGAEFVLKNAAGKYCKITNGEISWVAEDDDPEVFTSGSEGKFVIKGLDSGTYSLEETEAPVGYNKLAADIEITIGEEGAVSPASIIKDGDTIEYVKVENNTGTELPETGGIGTVIFRVGGAALIIVAAVLLIAKKRTNNI